jgi:subtilisin family serine protease
MDSGTDMSHKELVPKTWKNFKEKVGIVDVDGDGLPGDVYGFDFVNNKPNPFDAKYNYLITEDVKKFFNYYSHVDLKTVTKDEMIWLQKNAKNPKFMNDVNFVGGYIHGTHVAGIASHGNDKAKILPFKIIPTVYVDLSTQKPIQNSSGIPNDSTTTPSKTIEEFKNELILSASSQIEEMVQIHKVLNFHKVDVVNQSFGIGWTDAQKFIAAGFYKSIKRLPTKFELDMLVGLYFNKILTDGEKMFAAAPNTVFCIAAGNDSSDNDAHPDYPSSILADNRIVVAATKGNSSLADFSNYGAKKVDIAAPGVAINSTAPENNYIPLSGTSQATPFVVNTIAMMKDINPKLSARDVKLIVLGTVDVKPWLKGKVLTSGIINKARALKAAELSKTVNTDVAISKSKTLIADGPVLKSMENLENPKLDFKFTLKRPSLLIGI